MSEEKKHTIVIPPKVEYTKGLHCPVDPPCEFMDISFTKEGETKPFRVGKIIQRRCPEIAAFMFRPNRLNSATGSREPPLQAGDKINVVVTLYKSGDADKRTLSEPYQSEEKIVEVT